MSCAEAKKSRSVTAAGFAGAMQGIAGLVGAGGFWQPTASSELQDLMGEFQSLQSDWEKKIQNDENILTQSQQRFAYEQNQLMISSQNFKNEVLDDKININTLLIQITMVIVFTLSLIHISEPTRPY